MHGAKDEGTEGESVEESAKSKRVRYGYTLVHNANPLPELCISTEFVLMRERT
jgi:hypothetical protein